MGWAWCFGFGVVVFGVATTACDNDGLRPEPEPRWLRVCEANSDCGDSGQCLCGRCTLACDDSCSSGPEGTTCTRSSACGTPASGACVARCVRSSDCAPGLTCKGGLCTNDPAADADAGSGDGVEGLAGTLTTGAGAAWARTLPGISSTSPEIALGPDGDLVAKLTSERVPVGSTRYLSDDWLIRFDGATGTMKWLEKVPDYLSMGVASSMAVDRSGNVILAWPTLLEKLGPDGSLLWAQEREPEANYERARVAVDGEGNILIARTELSEAPGRIGGDPVGYVELEKLGSDGNPIFSRRFGDGTSLLDDVYLAADASNNILFLVSTMEGSADFGGGALADNNVLAKYDPEGEHVFSKALGGYGLIGNQANSPIQATPAGHIYFRNESIGPVDIGLGELDCFQYLFEFDGDGTPLANRCVHLDNFAVLPEGGYVTTYRLFEATTVSGEPCTPDYDDGLVARYDTAGTLLGKYCGADPGYQTFAGVLPASPGMLFLAGAYGGMLTLPGGTVLSPAAPNVSSAMVAMIPSP
jgi:hypothetical protein